MLISQGVIRTSDGPWSADAAQLRNLQVPTTLRGVVQARLDSLPPAEREALQLASVIGLRFWDSALAYLRPHAEVELQPLAQRELVLVEDPGGEPGESAQAARAYTFRHQILHQVTYDTVLKPMKRQAHALAAEWLSRYTGARGKELLASAAGHYERAGQPVKAVELYAQAAEHMQRSYANESALDTAAHALGLITDDMPDAVAQRWRLQRLREGVHGLLGRRVEQRADIEALTVIAESLPADDRRRAHAAYHLGNWAYKRGEWALAERETRRAIELAERCADDRIRLVAESNLGIVLCTQGQIDEAEALCLAGLERARALGDAELQRNFCVPLMPICDRRGDTFRALVYAQEYLRLSRESGDRRGLAVGALNIAYVYSNLGQHDAARFHALESLEHGRALEANEVVGGAQMALAVIAQREGDPHETRERASAAIDVQTASQQGLHLALALTVLGDAERELGQLDAADHAFERAAALAREAGDPAATIDALSGQVRVAMARGDPKLALERAEQLMAQATAAPAGPEAQEPDFEGSEVALVRLTLYQVWSAAEDPRAGPMLAAAHRRAMRDADRITDPALRESFLNNLPAVREIVALWTAALARR